MEKEKLILKRIAASNGIVEGVVKIVKGIQDIPSFEEYIKSPEFETYWLKDLYK